MIEDLLRRMKKALEFHTAETHPLVETENFMLEIDAELAKLNTMSVAELVDRVKRGEKWAVVHKPDQLDDTDVVDMRREPPPQRQSLTDEQQIAESLRRHGLTLVKTAHGYDVMNLGQITAHGIKEKNT